MPRFTSDAQRRYFYRVASGKARKKKGGLTKREAKQAIAENAGNKDLPKRA
jgi:hypothetical protein